MSSVKISGNASGTGILTIAAPNTNTDRTLTLPDEAGTLVTDANGLSYAEGAFTPSADAGFSQGNGTLIGKYVKIGKKVTIEVYFELGTTSSVTGSLTFGNLPYSPEYQQTFYGGLFETGSNTHIALCSLNGSATAFTMYYVNAGVASAQAGSLNASTPFTWATGDKAMATFTFLTA